MKTIVTLICFISSLLIPPAFAGQPVQVGSTNPQRTVSVQSQPPAQDIDAAKRELLSLMDKAIDEAKDRIEKAQKNLESYDVKAAKQKAGEDFDTFVKAFGDLQKRIPRDYAANPGTNPPSARLMQEINQNYKKSLGENLQRFLTNSSSDRIQDVNYVAAKTTEKIANLKAYLRALNAYLKTFETSKAQGLKNITNQAAIDKMKALINKPPTLSASKLKDPLKGLISGYLARIVAELNRTPTTSDHTTVEEAKDQGNGTTKTFIYDVMGDQKLLRQVRLNHNGDEIVYGKSYTNRLMELENITYKNGKVETDVTQKIFPYYGITIAFINNLDRTENQGRIVKNLTIDQDGNILKSVLYTYDLPNMNTSPITFTVQNYEYQPDGTTDVYISEGRWTASTGWSKPILKEVQHLDPPRPSYKVENL